MLIVLSLTTPVTKFGFIDRLIVGCELNNIEPVLIFNKSDGVDESEKEKYRFYNDIGIETIFISAKTGENIDDLKEIVHEKKTMFLGLSGVGKSTILNKLFNKDIAKTTDVSDYNMKGRHTTTEYQCYFLDDDTGIIDSPGIKQFQFFDINKKDLQKYFIEFIDKKKNCKFNDCIHIPENGCYIKDCVESGEINKNRYESYIKIYNSLDEIN